MPQKPLSEMLAAHPTKEGSPHQIATKKYVDDRASTILNVSELNFGSWKVKAGPGIYTPVEGGGFAWTIRDMFSNKIHFSIVGPNSVQMEIAYAAVFLHHHYSVQFIGMKETGVEAFPGVDVASPRWTVKLVDGSAETGNDTGSDFRISRFHDGDSVWAAPFSTPFLINRATGVVSLEQMPSIPGGESGNTIVTDGEGNLSWGASSERIKTDIKGEERWIDIAGSDETGDGTQAAPWATLRKMFDEFEKYYYISTASIITVHLSAGVFTGAITNHLVGQGYIYIKGAGSTLTTIDGGAACLGVINSSVMVSINNVTMIPAYGLYGLFIYDGEACLGDYWWDEPNDIVISTENTPWGIVSLYGDMGLLYTGKNGSIEVKQAGVSHLSGSFIYMENNSYFYDCAPWNFTGTPDTVGAYYNIVGIQGAIEVRASFTGIINGKSFNVNKFSYLNYGSIVLPGTIPGTWDSSSTVNGQYGLFIIEGGATKFNDIPTPGNANIILNKDVGGANDIIGAINGSTRWTLTLGNDAPEGVSATPGEGSDFTINRWDDTGKHLGSVFRASRSNGRVDIPNLATAVQFWLETGSYAKGDYVLRNGVLYTPMRSTGPGWEVLDWVQAVKPSLIAPLSLSIDAVGNDATGDGSEDAPWRSLDRAADFLSSINLNNQTVRIKIGAGEFVGGWIRSTSKGSIYITGLGPDQTILSVNPNCYYCLRFGGGDGAGAAGGGSYVIIGGCGFNLGTSGSAIYVGKGESCSLGATIIDATRSVYGLFFIAGYMLNNYNTIELKMNGRGAYEPAIEVNGGFFEEGGIYNLTGAPNTYPCWERVINFANHKRSGGGQGFTGVGIVGKKFEMANTSMIGTGNIGIEFWPGTTPGTWDSSSFYDGVPGPWISRINGGTF